MKAAVTAASGRLGHALLEKLKREIGGENVVGISRDPSRIQVSGIDTRAGDYNDLEQSAAAFAGVDTAIMISAPVTPGTDRVEMHRNLIQAAKQAGVRKLVYTSVIGNGKEEDTFFYNTQKINRVAEDDLAGSGLEWAVARNGLYLELDTAHIIEAAADDGVYRNAGGDGRCGYITIDEIAEATVKMAIEDKHNGRIYTIAGEPATQAELVAGVADIFGLEVRFETCTPEETMAKLMEDPKIAERGEEVGRMLAGCFQCIAKGAFDVPPDFEAAAGRPCKSLEEMFTDIKRERDGAIS